MWKAIITTVVLATSGAAMAQPSPYAEDDNYKDRYFNEHHRDLSEPRMPVHRRAVVLAQNVVLRSGRHQAPTYVAVDARFANLSRLRLDLRAGRTYVDNVEFVFADGHRETMPIRRMLAPGDVTSLAIDLPHGGVRGLFIETTSMRAGRGGGWRRNAAIVNVVGIRSRMQQRF